MVRKVKIKKLKKSCGWVRKFLLGAANVSIKKSGDDRRGVCVLLKCVAGIVEVETKNFPFVCKNFLEKLFVNGAN